MFPTLSFRHRATATRHRNGDDATQTDGLLQSAWNSILVSVAILVSLPYVLRHGWGHPTHARH